MAQQKDHHQSIREMKVDKLQVRIFSDRKALGVVAASAVANAVRAGIEEKGSIRMIFAAAPSQNETLAALLLFSDISWQKVTAFHMDEYLGLAEDAPQLFGNYLRTRLFERVPFHQVHTINSDAKDAHLECQRYSKLLQEAPIDIVCMGIGENGHIAFNDPPVADFHDPLWVKTVQIDLQSRQQQVNDGCFTSVDQVPQHAITVTIPALLSARYLFIMVPGPTKASAVHRTLTGRIEKICPATILRTHSDAILYIDQESAALI